MSNGTFGVRLLCASALAVVGFSGHAGAQGNPGGSAETDEAVRTLDSVIVSAQRRETALIDVPVTVTAIAGEALLDQGIVRLQDIVALTPNAVIQDNPESYNTFVNIRGMRVVDVQAEPNVGLYRNGMYMGGHRANLGAQVDVARVEILRGPQGGLYGRSSVGGTVDVIYATPEPEFGGYAKAAYGSYNRTEIQGAVNVPVSEASALRLAGWSIAQTESELFNETLNEYVGAFSDRGLRLGYSLDLSDKLNILWLAEHRETEGPSMKTYAPFGISNFGAVSQPETVNRIRRDTRSDAKSKETYLSQAITYTTEAGDLSLNASYKNYAFASIQDSDQTAIGPEDSPVARQTDIIRDEGTDSYYVEGLWVSPTEGRLDWIVGASYFQEQFDFARLITSRRNTPSFGIQTALIGFPSVGSGVETKSFSVFGTADLQVTDQLSVSGSLRYSEDKKDLTFEQGVLPTGTGNAALDQFFLTLLSGPYPAYSIASSQKFDNWSPSIVAKYAVTEDLNVYAVYSTGFRPGAFNFSPTTPETIPYGQETATNYEVGLKGRFLDGRLTTNIAGFLLKQDDLLLAQTTQLGGVDRTYLDNVGTARTYGVELEAQFAPTSWLSGGVSLGWLDPKFDDAVANPGLPSEQDLSGLLIPYTREWTANAVVNVEAPVTRSVDFVSTGAIRYETGGVLGDYYVNDPYDTMTKIDLSAGFAFNGQTRVTAYVRNLLDENISQFWFYNRGTNTSEGRTFGIDLTHRF